MLGVGGFCFALNVYVADAAQCDSGYVFLNNKCVACKSRADLLERAIHDRVYCPGVNSNANFTLEQQIKKCPNGAWPNENLADCDCKYGLTKQNGKCVGILSPDNLVYGPGGAETPLNEQCWANTVSYKKCMGFDTVDVADSNTANANDCGYVIVGKPGNYTFEQVSQQTNLGDKIKSINGVGGNNTMAVVKAEKSPLANTPDGCACPMYTFKYQGKEACFYNWDNPNELSSPIETIRTLNPGVSVNNGFACLLETNCSIRDYRIKLSYACDSSAGPDPDKNPYGTLSVSQIATYTTTPHTVKSHCPASNKPGWYCRILLRDAHDFYVDPSKSYKDNIGLREYIRTYGATDILHVYQGLQYYGNSRESEMIVAFCIPSDL